MAGICRMKLPVVFFRPHIRHGAINIKKTEHSRNSLGENGCISGSRNAHFKTNDEKQIKKNKQLEKKTRKKLAKHQKQLIKNQIKLQKAIQKEEKMKLAGKDLGGGNYDG